MPMRLRPRGDLEREYVPNLTPGRPRRSRVAAGSSQSGLGAGVPSQLGGHRSAPGAERARTRSASPKRESRDPTPLRERSPIVSMLRGLAPAEIREHREVIQGSAHRLREPVQLPAVKLDEAEFAQTQRLMDALERYAEHGPDEAEALLFGAIAQQMCDPRLLPRGLRLMNKILPCLGEVPLRVAGAAWLGAAQMREAAGQVTLAFDAYGHGVQTLHQTGVPLRDLEGMRKRMVHLHDDAEVERKHEGVIEESKKRRLHPVLHPVNLNVLTELGHVKDLMALLDQDLQPPKKPQQAVKLFGAIAQWMCDPQLTLSKGREFAAEVEPLLAQEAPGSANFAWRISPPPSESHHDALQIVHDDLRALEFTGVAWLGIGQIHEAAGDGQKALQAYQRGMELLQVGGTGSSALEPLSERIAILSAHPVSEQQRALSKRQALEAQLRAIEKEEEHDREVGFKTLGANARTPGVKLELADANVRLGDAFAGAAWLLQAKQSPGWSVRNHLPDMFDIARRLFSAEGKREEAAWCSRVRMFHPQLREAEQLREYLEEFNEAVRKEAKTQASAGNFGPLLRLADKLYACGARSETAEVYDEVMDHLPHVVDGHTLEAVYRRRLDLLSPQYDDDETVNKVRLMLCDRLTATGRYEEAANFLNETLGAELEDLPLIRRKCLDSAAFIAAQFGDPHGAIYLHEAARLLQEDEPEGVRSAEEEAAVSAALSQLQGVDPTSAAADRDAARDGGEAEAFKEIDALLERIDASRP